MKENRKHRAWKYAIVFLGIMLFFTFFSRTLYNATLPKISKSTIRSGYIQQSVTADQANYQAADGETALSVALPEGIDATADRVAVQCGQSVQKGELLLSFTDNAEVYQEINEELTRLRYEKQKYENALDTKQRSLQLQTESLKATREEMEKNYSKAPKAQKPALERNIAQLQLQLDIAKNELALLEQYGIVEGIGPEAANPAPISEIEQCLANFDPEQGLLAPRTGLVANVSVRPGEEISGALLTLIRQPEEAVLTLVTHDRLSGQEQLKNVTCSIQLSEGTVQGVLLECQTVSAGTALAIELPEGPKPLGTGNETGTSVQLTIDSPFYDSIAPNDALLGGRLFLLTETENFWGKQYFVRQLDTTILLSGRSESALQEDPALRKANVVTAYSRTLQDGDQVRPYGG